VLGRQLQDQAAAIPQGEQVGQEQEHPQVGALAVHIGGHPGQGVGQLVQGQPRQHPGVGAQGVAVEANGPGCLQPLEVAGLGLLDAPGEIDRPAAGAVGEFQQGPAVVDQLKPVSKAREGGVFKPGRLSRSLRLRRWGGEGAAGGGWPAAAGGGHGLLMESELLPVAAMDDMNDHAGSTWL
jgi:hypothetical protein